MVSVYIPSPLLPLSAGQEVFDLSAGNVRGLVKALDEICPGFREVLLEGEQLKPGVSVAVDDVISPLGALTPTTNCETVVFVPTLSGG